MNANVQRLAPVTPEGDRTDWADGTPIVLWSGAEPAAILQYRHRRDMEKLTVEQTLALVDGSERKGPFPLTFRTKLEADQRGPSADALSAGDVVPADLDGDGVQELVLFRVSGAIEVHGLAGPRAKAGPSGAVPLTPHRVRLGARETLLFPMVPPPGRRAPLAPAILRVDAGGVASVRLAGVPDDAELLAAGSVVREGAAEIDELLAVFESRGKKFLSRHRPDGAAVGPAREIYVPYPAQPGVELRSLPASGRNVVLDGHDGAVLFIAATKPANWIRRVELTALAGAEERPDLVGAVDGRDGAKAVVRVGDGLYLVDEEARFIGPGGARSAPGAKPQPFLRLSAPAAGARLVGVYESSGRDDEWLVVHTRPAGVRPLSRDELLAAAKRFLQPYEVDFATQPFAPRLDRPDPTRDARMRDESRKRGIDHPITTVEQWKRELPDSYAATVRDHEAERDADLTYRLTAPKARREGTGRYRDEAEHRRWLEGVETPAQTTLTLVRRGTVVARQAITGEAVQLVESDVACSPVAFRASGDRITAVLALRGAGGPGAAPDPALHLVRSAGGR